MDRKKTSGERADLGEEVDVLGLKKIWQDGITPRPEHELDPRVPGLSEFCEPPQCLGRPFDAHELQACHTGSAVTRLLPVPSAPGNLGTHSSYSEVRPH